MTAHLLLVTLGPVQDFIAQARRTRDLWFGSHLLSELSRRAARALAEGGAQLIFPALSEGDGELETCTQLLRPDGVPPQNIANKLLAEVPAGIEPRGLASRARGALMQFWRDELAAGVKRKCSGLLDESIEDVWREQVETFIEFHAAWAPLAETQRYREAREAVESAVAGQKALRDFEPWRRQRRWVNKSTLDGARETVLAPWNRRDPGLARANRINDREELDAVGLIKRAGGTPGQFVPVVNIAATGWLQRVRQEAPDDFKGLVGACEVLDQWRGSPVRRAIPCAQLFRFEASVLYLNRLEPVWREFAPLVADEALAVSKKNWRDRIGQLHRRFGEPCPYVACLMADGDGMGRTLDALGSAEAHRKFSKALASFATKTRAIVEQEHLGALVYAGGDDVLAFVPLHRALACAEALRTCFESIMVSALSAAGAPAGGDAPPAPTLSVGIGVGHMLESLGDLLALGREAEKLAKGASLRPEKRRNALAVLVKKRTGDRRQWRAQWHERPVARLQEAVGAVSRLPSNKVYEVARLLSRLPKPSEVNDPAWAELLALEVGRSLGRVYAGETPFTPGNVGLSLVAQVVATPEVGAAPEKVGYAALRAEVVDWIEQMLIARTFATAAPRADDDQADHFRDDDARREAS